MACSVGEVGVSLYVVALTAPDFVCLVFKSSDLLYVCVGVYTGPVPCMTVLCSNVVVKVIEIGRDPSVMASRMCQLFCKFHQVELLSAVIALVV